MAASLHRSREVPLGAMWTMFQDALIRARLANTSSATTLPSLNGPYSAWTPYFLATPFIELTGGSVAYDTSVTSRAVLPRLTFTLNYNTSVTYTDIVVQLITTADAVAPPPEYVTEPLLAIIHEDSPITLAANQTKTYKLDFFSEWA